MARLAQVEGIGDKYAQKLVDAGVETTGQFLDKGKDPQGRSDLAEKTGISEKLLLEWLNHIDLFRINGVSEEYADLLEEAGVDTVPELAQRNPANLYDKLVETNTEKKLVRRMPSREQVGQWVDQAKKLPRMIQY